MTGRPVVGKADDPVWNARETLLVRLADELHETSTIGAELWEALAAEWSDAELLELIAISGMYHAVSFMVNATGVEYELFGEKFPTQAASSRA